MAHTIGREFASGENAVLSFSTYLTVSQALPYRNESDDALHKVVGGLMLAGLALASLIEAVVRGIIAGIGALVSLCLPEDQKKIKDFLFTHFTFGALISAENFLNCIGASIENVRSEKVVYDEIAPCMNGWNQKIQDSYFN